MYPTMKSTLILVILVMYSVIVEAQGSTQLYKVNPGEQVRYALPFDVRYTYPEFRMGVVQFRNGNMGGGLMNYSTLLEEMDFVAEKQDTMALAELPAIRYVAVSSDTFYRSEKFFLRQLKSNGEIRLAERRSLNLVNREKYGEHGELQSSSSVLAVEQISAEINTLRQMTAKELMTFAITEVYYFGDKFGTFKVANKKNLMDLFGKKYPGLSDFLAQNKVNYQKEDDMKLVFEYLTISVQHK